MTTCVNQADKGNQAKLPSPSKLRERLLHRPTTANWAAHQHAAQDEQRLSIELRATTARDVGCLDQLVEETLEGKLVEQGASFLERGSSPDLGNYIKDALYRARLLGAGGLALAFGELSALASDRGVLNERDSHTIRTLLKCAEDQSLHLYFPPTALKVQLLGMPRPLSSWLPERDETAPGAVIEFEDNEASGMSEVPVVGGAPAMAAFAIGASSAQPQSGASQQSDSMESSIAKQPEQSEPHPRCSAWAAQLGEMSGPKVHGAIEKAFTEAYIPLRQQVATGKGAPNSEQLLLRWAEDFAQSYSSAFDNMQRHSRRPKMVTDVQPLAARWAEHYRVAHCEMLVISGLRYDLGGLLMQKVRASLDTQARCVEQSVLWAALPSNSRSQQLDSSLANRADSLMFASRDSQANASSNLTLHRLNSLDTQLASAGEEVAPRLKRLAGLLEEQLVPWMLERKPNTLVVVFGDHGFSLAANELGTSAGAVGGALPEQVLVPVYGWIVEGPKTNSGGVSQLKPGHPPQPLN